jgi:hypothetical protein
VPSLLRGFDRCQRASHSGAHLQDRHFVAFGVLLDQHFGADRLRLQRGGHHGFPASVRRWGRRFFEKGQFLPSSFTHHTILI